MQIWEMIPLCIFCTLWLERTTRCFENWENHLASVKNSRLLNLYLWCWVRMAEDLDQYMDFIEALRM